MSKKNLSEHRLDDKFLEPINRHSYCVGHAALSLGLVLESIGMRGAEKVFKHFKSFITGAFKAPSFHTIRQWLLKLGLYKLQRDKARSDDWIFIADHSIQLGSYKCLVVLGIQASNLPHRPLKHDDLEPIHIALMPSSDGEAVRDELFSISNETGITPKFIVSDAGSDLKKGINLYCQHTHYTKHIYDISHLCANLLKRTFSKDESWLSFIGLCEMVKGKLRQTDAAPFLPPKQRSKAKYLHIGDTISWSAKMLNILECEDNDDGENMELVKLRFSWILAFKENIGAWNNIMKIVQAALLEIKHNGLSRKTADNLSQTVGKMHSCTESLNFFQVLLEQITTLSYQVSIGDRVLGCSDVIESLFGKFKSIERQYSGFCFTQLVLAIPALVSQSTSSVIKDALTMIRVADVKKWVSNNMPQSSVSKRMSILKGITG